MHRLVALPGDQRGPALGFLKISESGATFLAQCETGTRVSTVWSDTRFTSMFFALFDDLEDTAQDHRRSHP